MVGMLPNPVPRYIVVVDVVRCALLLSFLRASSSLFLLCLSTSLGRRCCAGSSPVRSADKQAIAETETETSTETVRRRGRGEVKVGGKVSTWFCHGRTSHKKVDPHSRVLSDTVYLTRKICTTEFFKAKNAGKLFDEYSLEGFNGESIKGMQPKKRRTRINY